MTLEALEPRVLLSIDVRPITLKTNALLSDPTTGLIFASVPGAAGSIGNSITAIDPVAGTVGNSVFVGSEPGKLAETDNGLFLYVNLSGAGSVRRYNILRSVPGLQWSLGPGNSANDLQTVPGNAHASAVAVNGTLKIYDDDVARPKTVGGAGSIAYSATPDRVYAYNNQSTEFGFRRITVDDTGATQQDTTGGLICCFNTYIKYDAGLIYSTHGEVIDPEPASGPPKLVGTYSGIGFASDMVPDSTINRVYFLTNNQLVIFRQDTFTLVASYNLPSSGNSLIRWGSNGLAYENGNTVYLVTVTEEGLPSTNGEAVLQIDPLGAQSLVRPSLAAGTIVERVVPGGERSEVPESLPLAGENLKEAGTHGPSSDLVWIEAGGGAGGEVRTGPLDGGDLDLLALPLTAWS